MEILKKINTAITIIGLAASAYDIMQKTFKWYEKKRGNKKEDTSRPVVKGV